MDHKLEISDEIKANDKPGGVEVKIPSLNEYEVINELFKNGKTYNPGEKIMLVETAAKNFINSGDIK